MMHGQPVIKSQLVYIRLRLHSLFVTTAHKVDHSSRSDPGVIHKLFSNSVERYSWWVMTEEALVALVKIIPACYWLDCVGSAKNLI
jgi:hypothetical protein